MAKSLNLQGAHEELKQKHVLLRNEYQVVKRKLDSKNDALLILSRDLAESQAERDQFKLMADQLRNRCQALKKQLQSDKTDMSATVYQCPVSTVGITSQLEVDDLKQRLADAEGDIKILREKIIKHRLGTSEQQQSQRKTLSVHERDELINEMEKSQLECTQLEQDMKQLLDLKEELETERDTYKSKYNRLNTELNFIMRGDEKHVVDIDALIMENRFLQQRVKQLQEENSVVSSSLNKYKHLIEKKKPAGILRTTTSNVLGGVLISQRQVKQLLASPDTSSSVSTQVVQELKSLASTLLETINDKNLALNHQRKSNKLLASRITDLENKLRAVELSADSNHLKERFEGWSELREDCTNIKSLIPTSSVDSSEADTTSDREDTAILLSELADLDIATSNDGANHAKNNNCAISPQKSHNPTDTSLETAAHDMSSPTEGDQQSLPTATCSSELEYTDEDGALAPPTRPH